MSTTTFSSLSDGAHLAFDPDSDVILFDDIGISASAVSLGDISGNLSLTYGGKTVWLDNMSINEVAVWPTVNVEFANGSLLAIGDATSHPLADWYGQNYSSLLGASTVGNQVWGLGGADTVITGSGADWIVGNAALSALDLVSRVGSSGSPSYSYHPSVSADGRFVAFRGGWEAFGSNSDSNADALVKDMNSGIVSNENVNAAGEFPPFGSTTQKISADGSTLVFVGSPSGLAPGESGSFADILVSDVTGSGIVRANTDSSGQTAKNGDANHPDVSANGRYVVFESSTNFASGATEPAPWNNIFVKDMLTGSMTRLTNSHSTSDSGGGNDDSFDPSISADGRFVVFTSEASNLLPGDLSNQDGGTTDVFIWDREDGGLENLTDKMNGVSQGDGGNRTEMADIAFDDGYGGSVVFQTFEAVVSKDDNDAQDIYAYNAFTNKFTRVSAKADGSDANGESSDASVSGDGRFVVFTSWADDFVPGDNNGVTDIYVKDTFSGAIALVSKSTGGTVGNDASFDAEISLGGDFIVFQSHASNFSSADGNGNGADVFRVSNPLLKDSLQGGAGNDTYVLYRADTIVESEGGGTDTVQSAFSYTLGNNLEHLVLTGEGSINGTGNNLNNAITGGAGNNALSGNGGNDTLNGGAGVDTMTGGDGSDKYTVNHSGDLVTESNASAASGGTDTVNTSIGYTLPANVENLKINASGSVNGTGNGLNNVITAGAGNNVLKGSGGNDTVSYAGAASAVTISLALTGAQASGGSGSDTLASFENLTGSSYSDKLTGSSTANVVNGGAGNDLLTGGAGADNFRFASALNASTNKDTVTDFSSGSDRLTLDDAVFTKLGAVGALGSGAFQVGTAARDSSDRIVYDQSTGNLFYDADGTGAVAKLLFANLGAGTVLAASDLWIG